MFNQQIYPSEMKRKTSVSKQMSEESITTTPALQEMLQFLKLKWKDPN